MGVFAKLLRRSSGKSTADSAEATPPEETGAPAAEATAPAAGCTTPVAGATWNARERDTEERNSGERNAEDGSPCATASGEGPVKAARDEAPSQDPVTGAEAEPAAATVEPGDGVGIPQQHSPGEAAGSGTGDSVRK
ncbi:hypothetical protein [Streptomyces iconiensis]|uniref:Uncharacterized protein n=1 Tax=Streptomyces iconiensis TaxID=1384038 RepID=A0ABT6ZPD0_9ACTN|nr:hypothetical protein [Streptomyces iconiensis]MDJ1130905.1 hypothetical protein [Streptomyces iconiensis]